MHLSPRPSLDMRQLIKPDVKTKKSEKSQLQAVIPLICSPEKKRVLKAFAQGLQTDTLFKGWSTDDKVAQLHALLKALNDGKAELLLRPRSSTN